MVSHDHHHEYYQALIQRNSEYEGIFYVGVTSTGIFCRPTCTARKPKFEHCEFFETAQQALLASYRPCKICQPLSRPGEASSLVQMLVDAVEANPSKRWTQKDFQQLAVDASTARRQFHKRFGMTFVAYARARRLGIAMKEIRAGRAITDAQLSAGYESASGFHDAFSRIMGEAPASAGYGEALKISWIDTRLGPMVAIADDCALYLLEFVDRRGLEREIERLRLRIKAPIIPGTSDPLRQIEKELTGYFNGTQLSFETPLALHGTPFERRVWDALQEIPPGQTRSYGEVAAAIGNPMAYRAVARANGANTLALAIPCHRVILENGLIGGYGGGTARKQWLINHERSYNPAT